MILPICAEEKNKLCESCKFFRCLGDEFHTEFANIYKYWVETVTEMRYNKMQNAECRMQNE